MSGGSFFFFRCYCTTTDMNVKGNDRFLAFSLARFKLIISVSWLNSI